MQLANHQPPRASPMLHDMDWTLTPSTTKKDEKSIASQAVCVIHVFLAVHADDTVLDTLSGCLVNNTYI